MPLPGKARIEGNWQCGPAHSVELDSRQRLPKPQVRMPNILRTPDCGGWRCVGCCATPPNA